MSFKLVAFDLDGTLLNEHAEITENTRMAIQRLADCGVTVTIATGRVFQSAAYFAHLLGINVPLITCDGALVKESDTGFEHYHKKVRLDLAKEIADYGSRYDIYLRYYIGDVMYVDRNWDHAQMISKRLRIQAEKVDSLKDFLKEEPTLISITEPAEKFNTYFQPLYDHFHDLLTLTRFTASAGASGLGIIHKEASKGKALSVLADHLGIKKEEIVAFGDDLNDIGLFQGAGFKVAMGNAEQTIKDLSDHICGSNREDGVAKAIDDLIIPSIVK